MTSSGNPIVDWNEVILDAIRLGPPAPTAISRALDITHTAMYDAWTAYDPQAASQHLDIKAPEAEQTEANALEAVSFAAYKTALALFALPQQQALFHAHMQQLGFDGSDHGVDPATASGVGNIAAATVLAARSDDGSNAANGFADTSGYVPVNSADPDSSSAPGGEDYDPNHWQPLRVPTGAVLDDEGHPVVTDDPASYRDQSFLTPHWGGVDPFALESGDQFRPPAPPQKGDFTPYVDGKGVLTTNDAAWHAQFDEVLQISADLTPEQKAIAEFWADGPRSETPPGHWNQLAQGVALRDDFSLGDSVKLFFALNNAMLDAAITAWDAKAAYDSARPVSAIRDEYFDQLIEAWGGPDLGTQTILGQDWQPYQQLTFVTPAFPEYISGHSTFSAAAASVLDLFAGGAGFHDGVSVIDEDIDGDGALDLLGEFNVQHLAFESYAGPPITLQWATFYDAAEEAGLSRLYGGIHIQDGDLFGRLAGRAVGEQAFALSELLFEGIDDFAKQAGSQAEDHLAGKAALDVLLGFAGDDVLQGGAGDDRLYGGSGDDLLRGGAGDDRLWGSEGDDELTGFGGDDLLFGSVGDDVLRGGEGDDRAFGDIGDDELRGGAGDDRLAGGQGADELYGNEGDDLLAGGGGDDYLCGGEGHDALDGGDGEDELIGNDGDDLLHGGAGADDLRGGKGDDVLDGGAGADLLSGGAGGDLFVFRLGEADGDAVLDFNGAAGDEILLLGYGEDAVFEAVDGAPGDWLVRTADGVTQEVIHFGPGAGPEEGEWSFAA